MILHQPVLLCQCIIETPRGAVKATLHYVLCGNLRAKWIVNTDVWRSRGHEGGILSAESTTFSPLSILTLLSGNVNFMCENMPESVRKFKMKLTTNCHIRVFHDKQIWQICQIWQKLIANFQNYHNLDFKGKGYLIFSVLTRLWVHCQNRNKSKE